MLFGLVCVCVCAPASGAVWVVCSEAFMEMCFDVERRETECIRQTSCCSVPASKGAVGWPFILISLCTVCSASTESFEHVATALS